MAFIERSSAWKSFGEKQRSYLANFENGHDWVGKFDKHSAIAQAAGDTVYWCRIAASCEMGQINKVIEKKKEKSLRSFSRLAMIM
ncbi:MAG: hypothetical protein LLG93_17985 [Deltaproteobacteria bacterium]|nr:hypothetical protein [Deltaproteobacteria bacterium]